ncbi:LysM peptidoglycan-binding domain-containing protein [Effusibacillus dendaii]|uniref:LysM domain-containing protein n=1 Tax=Effusibacillus dendaii TaxID=2743772 RepID=A0A7I8DDL5_9BACL|nr:LysM peptidoglycan-binding domain-containing protein [Effusibacillus dendaii]BCJ88117.1 hypothetical protein skT53_31020 [Effusibacillus dendaii]
MITHLVQQGDTLWKIAQKNGVTLSSLIAANPQIPDPDKLDVGQVIHIPVHGNMPEPTGTMTTYTVQEGDTLWKIAKETGNSLANVIAANPQIANPEMIAPGQIINIPAPYSIGHGGLLHHKHLKMPMTKEQMTMPIAKEQAMMPIAKEKLTMPKPKEMVTKPIEVAPVPVPAPVTPPPAPVKEETTIIQHVDVELDYEPHYTKVEIKEQPKPKEMPKPKLKEMPKPTPVVQPIQYMPMPCPPPMVIDCTPCSPCPPGMYPALMDEFGNLYPYPGLAPAGYPAYAPYGVTGPAMYPYATGLPGISADMYPAAPKPYGMGMAGTKMYETGMMPYGKGYGMPAYRNECQQPNPNGQR